MRRLATLIALCFASCVEPAVAPDVGASVDAGPPLCSPLTCSGCCRNNVCRGGNEQGACGYDGRQCKECGADTLCASPGTCAGLPGDGGALRSYEGDAGLTNPLTGGPLQPPTQKCVFIFGVFICS